MKKIFYAFLIFAISVCFVACGSEDTSTSKNSEEATVERDLPEGDYSDMGDGMMYISTESGTSENGNVPIIYLDPEEEVWVLQIGMYTEGFNGSLISYINVDGVEISKEQLGDAQISIDLEKDQLTEGKHKVEVVQYTDNDKSKDMVTYKSAEYEVKSME